MRMTRKCYLSIMATAAERGCIGQLLIGHDRKAVPIGPLLELVKAQEIDGEDEVHVTAKCVGRLNIRRVFFESSALPSAEYFPQLDYDSHATTWEQVMTA